MTAVNLATVVELKAKRVVAYRPQRQEPKFDHLDVTLINGSRLCLPRDSRPVALSTCCGVILIDMLTQRRVWSWLPKVSATTTHCQACGAHDELSQATFTALATFSEVNFLLAEELFKITHSSFESVLLANAFLEDVENMRTLLMATRELPRWPYFLQPLKRAYGRAEKAFLANFFLASEHESGCE